jgi:hypothetical protein
MYRLLRGVSTKKIVRIVGTIATRGSRVEVSRQQAQKKICWDFAHALLELAVSSLASGRGGPRYCGGQQSGLKKRLSAYPKPQKELQLRSPMHRGFPLGPLPSRRPAVDLKKHMPCVLYNRPGACARSYCIASPLTSLPASCAGGAASTSKTPATSFSSHAIRDCSPVV